MAESLEESMNSSIRNRIRAAKCREASVSREVFKANDPTDRHAFSKADAETLFADCWLAPIGTDGPLLTEESPAASVQVTGAPSGKQGQSVKQAAHEPAECCDSEAHSAMEAELAVGIPTSSQSERRHDIAGRPNPDPVETDKQKRTWPVLTRRRASDAPFLTVRWSDYLRALESIAAFTNPSQAKRPEANDENQLAEHIMETLGRWGLNPIPWLNGLSQLDRQCTRVLGTAQHMIQRAQQASKQRFHGIPFCRRVFGSDDGIEFT